MQNDRILLEKLESDYLEPPADEKPLDHCSCCGEPLFYGDTVWDIDGDIYCDDCAKDNFKKTLTEGD